MDSLISFKTSETIRTNFKDYDKQRDKEDTESRQREFELKMR